MSVVSRAITETGAKVRRENAIAEFFELATQMLQEVMPLIQAAVKEKGEKN